MTKQTPHMKTTDAQTKNNCSRETALEQVFAYSNFDVKFCIVINPFMLNGPFYLNSLDRSISKRRGIRLFFITIFIKKNLYLNANSVDPNQTPRSATFDLGLHCL